MTFDEMLQKYRRLMSEAQRHGLSAPHVELVYAAVLKDLEQLDVPATTVVPDNGPKTITVKEAAARIGMSAEWIYKNKRNLSWVIKLDSGGVRCDAAKLERWWERQRRAA